MIFQATHQQVLDGRKTQTRRPVKPGEYAVMGGPGLMEWTWLGEGSVPSGAIIIEVRGPYGRLKWKVGKDYAAQPGRGKRSIGRTPPIKGIRRESLWDITEEDCRAEGVKPFRSVIYRGQLRTAFVGLWISIYKENPYRWADNPDVWALEFEPVEET